MAGRGTDERAQNGRGKGPGLSFALLGPLRARRGEIDVDLGPPLQRAVLAYLLLHHGRPVPDSELIDAVWGDAPPTSALRALRTYVWRLRTALEPGRSRSARAGIITRTDGGYRLRAGVDVDTDADREIGIDLEIDIVRFETLATEADRARCRGDLEAAIAVGREALALWRGEALTGLDGAYATVHRARLTERRLALLESVLATELDLGRHAAVVDELTGLVTAYPVRERLRALLMRALHGCGRTAEAVATYDALQRLLVEQYGLDPGAEITQLYRQLTASGSTASSGFTDQGPEPATDPGGAGRKPAQLPPDTLDFTGRTAQFARLRAALGHNAAPVCVLTGIGGVGKTALAVHAGHVLRSRYPDGQLYVDLRGQDARPLDPATVLTRFLRALAVPEDTLPTDLTGLSATFRETLTGRRVLAILDNARDADQVRPVLPGVPGCAVVVTSRSRLAEIATGRPIELDALPTDEAIELLGRILGPERVAGEPEATRAVAEACGGLPLALRILGSRLAARPTWTVAQLATRLASATDRLRELRMGELAIDAAFRVGYDQLGPSQARAFRLLATLDVEDLGVPAAAAVLDVSGEVAAALLSSLADLGLVSSPAGGRYAYHDLVRLFARSRAESGWDGPIERVSERLLDFFLATARSGLRFLWPDDPVLDALEPTTVSPLTVANVGEARDWLRAEWPNLLASIAAAVDGPDRALRLAGDLLLCLQAVAETEHRWPELAAAAEPMIAAADARGDERTAARVCAVRALALVESSRLEPAAAMAYRAAEYFRRTDDLPFLYDVLNTIALIRHFQRDDPGSVRFWEEALAVARRLGNRSYEAHLLANVAPTYLDLRDEEAAVAAAERSRALHRELDDLAGVMHAEHNLGRILERVGRTDDAADALDESLTLARRLGDRSWETMTLRSIARLHLDGGRPAEALGPGEASLHLARALANERSQADTLVVIGRALHALGRTAEARERLQEAYDIYERLSLPNVRDVRKLLDEV